MYPGNLDPIKGGDPDRKEQLQFVGSHRSTLYFWYDGFSAFNNPFPDWITNRSVAE